MNSYTYAEIAVGQKESFSASITDEMIEGFGRITGDANPLHTDDAFARASGGYRGKVAYGMLTASFLSALAGMYLPGEHSVIHEVSVKFPAPVYAGETVTFTGEVVRKDDTYHVIELKIAAVNSGGKKVLRGKMNIGVLK